MIFIIMLLTSLSIGIAAFIVAIEIRRKGKTAREYYLNYRVLSYKKTSKTQRILDFIEVVIVKIFYFFAVIILSSGVSLLLSLLRSNYNEYILIIYQSANVDLVNWVGLMITVAAILVAFKKEYYLTFSIEDVLGQFRFKERLLNIVLAMLGSGIIVSLQNIFFSMQQLIGAEPGSEEYQYLLTVLSRGLMLVYLFLLAYSILTGVYLIYRVIYILYSKEQSELEILSSLYYKLNSREFLVNGDLLDGRKGIAINGEYLFEQFKEAYNKIKNKEIYDVRFKTVFDGDKFVNRNAENKILIRFTLLHYALYLIACITKIADSLKEGIDYSYLLKYLGIYFIVWITVIVIFKWERLNKYTLTRGFKQILYRMVYASEVFTYRMKRRRKEKIAVLGGRGGVDNFITSTINLMVYLKILICNKKTEEDEEIINKYIKDIQKYIEELKSEVEEENRKKEEKKKEGDKVDCIFYAVNICYEFFRYVNTEGEKQKNILKENKDKDWIKIIKSRDKEWKRIENVIVELIKPSQNLYEGNPMQKWHAFKKEV